MSHSALPPPATGGQPLGSVELIQGRHGLLVSPPAKTVGEDCFEPFPLPLLPRSLADQAAFLADAFWQHQHRCMAFLLLLNCEQHCWRLWVPRQHCGPDASCWSLTALSQTDPGPHWRVGGSIQSRILNDQDEEILDAIPLLPGVHQLLRIHPERQGVWSTLCLRGRVYPVMPHSILFDDFRQLFDDSRDRLHFG